MNIINYALLLTFPISLISGLFVAPWTCAIIAIMLWHFWNNIRLKDFAISKLEGTIIAYAFCSCLWSIEPQTSIFISMQLAMIILLVRFIINNTIVINYPKLLFGISIALIIFYIEKFSAGSITLFFRSLTAHNKNFYLSSLDRGCALLSVLTWPILYMLIQDGKKALALFLYAMVLIMLLMSDSTAGLLGFIMATIGYILLNISKMKLAWLIKLSMILYIIAMPIASKIENPRHIGHEYGHIIPISHIHRLLIWNFVVNQGIQHPIIGQGIGTSKFTPIQEENKFFYKDEMLSPLPLHPHNNVLQIFLELGVIGLVLFGLYIWQILSSIKKRGGSWSAIANATFINYFVVGMVAFGIWQSWWMLAGLLAVMFMTASSHPKSD